MKRIAAEHIFALKYLTRTVIVVASGLTKMVSEPCCCGALVRTPQVMLYFIQSHGRDHHPVATQFERVDQEVIMVRRE